MSTKFLHPFWVLLLIVCTPARAGTLSVALSDQNNQPVADAVVSLVLEDGTVPKTPFTLPVHQIIDQRHETFIPLVTIVPPGGEVAFSNADHTMHQVYSFSDIKQFEFTLDPGTTSPPVRFSQIGVAAIGCNIHDNMIAYAYVTASPFTVLSGADGKAVIRDLPAGSYKVQLWHPRLSPRATIPAMTVKTGSGDTDISMNATLLPAKPHRMHMNDY